MNKKPFLSSLIAITFLLSATIASAAFTPPSAPPPGNNTLPPLHVGSDAQSKKGNLVIEGLDDAGFAKSLGLGVLNGNVGLGTLFPAYKLTIREGDASFATDNRGIRWNGISGWDWYIQAKDTGASNVPLHFKSNYNGSGLLSRMTISSNGNVGIGTETPAGKLHVQTAGGGDEGVRVSAGAGSGYVRLASGASYPGYIDWINGAGTRLSYLGYDSTTNMNWTLENGANLQINGGNVELAGQIKIAGGNPGAGKVLTSDANGLARWEALSTPTTSCTDTDVLMGTYSINLNSGNNAATNQLLVGGLTAGTYKIMGNGDWSSVGGGGALGIYHGVSSAMPAAPGAPASATAPGTLEVSLYSVGSYINYVQHYGADSGTWTAGSGSNENTFTITQTENLYAGGGQSAMSGFVTLYRVVSSCSATGTASAPVGTCNADPIRTIAQSNSGTEYQNTTGAQLMVVATASETSFSGQNALAGYIGATSASTLASQEIFTSTNRNSITFLVPPGYYYKVVNGATNSPTLNAQVWKLCSSGSTSSGATGGGAIANSGNLTIPSDNGTSVAWSHGLGQKPGFVRVVLVSLVDQSADQGSYLAGEELDVSNSVYVPSGGNYVSIPTLVTPTQVILPHQWSSYRLNISANRVGTYDTGIEVNRSTWAIKIYAGTSVGSSGGGTGTGTTGSGMLGNVPDAILCESPSTSDNSRVILYAQGVNNVSWTAPGRMIYSSDSDAGPHLTVYFHPTTGAWIDDVVGLSDSYTAAINGCRNKSLSQQTGFKFAGINNVTSGTTAGTTVLPNFPDALACTGSLGTYVYTSRGKSTGGSVSYYYVDGTQYMTFGPSGSWTSSNMDSRYDASCRNKSISELYSTGEAFNFVGGTPAPTGGSSSSVSLSDIRSGLTYTAICSAGAERGLTNASCTATCATGKKVVSGSCTAKTAAGTNAWVPYPINTSAPVSDGSGWMCNGVSPASNTAVQVSGSAICL